MFGLLDEGEVRAGEHRKGQARGCGLSDSVQTDAGDYGRSPEGGHMWSTARNSAMDLFRDAAQEEHVV